MNPSADLQGVVDVQEAFDARYSAAAQLQAFEDHAALPLGEIDRNLQIRTLAEAQAAGFAPRARQRPGLGAEPGAQDPASFDNRVEQVGAEGFGESEFAVGMGVCC